MRHTSEALRGDRAPLIPDNIALISPYPLKLFPRLPKNILPLLSKSLKIVQLLPKSPNSPSKSFLSVGLNSDT